MVSHVHLHPYHYLLNFIYESLRQNARYFKLAVQVNSYVQSNLSYVTFQENIKMESHKTGGHLIQV